MQNEILKALAIAQEKLKAINSLSNNMQKLPDVNSKDDIAYLIHRIIESDYFTSELSREVTSVAIHANQDLFMTVK